MAPRLVWRCTTLKVIRGCVRRDLESDLLLCDASRGSTSLESNLPLWKAAHHNLRYTFLPLPTHTPHISFKVVGLDGPAQTAACDDEPKGTRAAAS
jgi:hypothetical protein